VKIRYTLEVSEEQRKAITHHLNETFGTNRKIASRADILNWLDMMVSRRIELVVTEYDNEIRKR